MKRPNLAVSRRSLMFGGAAVAAGGLAAVSMPRTSLANAREITWDDLLPPGVPYAQIIAEGEIDYANDTWNPVYDANATKLNEDLDGARIRMPGYIIPLDFAAKGVTSFVLVPYVGACIHTPPPPPNQLVFAETKDPWPSDSLWDAVWVTGVMQTEITETELANTGYTLSVDEMERFIW